MGDLSVLVNATASWTGGGLTYTLHQLSELERLPGIGLTVLTSARNRSVLSGALKSPIEAVDTERTAVRFAFEQSRLPLQARSFDVLYCPNNFAPISKLGTPTVLTIQDLNYFTPREWWRANLSRFEKIKRRVALASALRADRIVTISRTQHSAIASRLPRVADKLDVIYSGAPTWSEQSQEPPRTRLESRTFLLCLANAYPHKRLELLVAAWAGAFGAAGRRPDLVICGRISTAQLTALEALVPTPARRSLQHLGPITQRAQIRWLIENALALVTTSELESFPLTPAEAGSLGCPTIASDIPAHREVAAEHALYFPAGDQASLSELLGRVWQDPPPRVRWDWPHTWSQNALRLSTVLRSAARRGA